VELKPSSYVGYELKHEALQGARRYGEAVQAFKTMLSKLDVSQDAQLRRKPEKLACRVKDVNFFFQSCVDGMSVHQT
jgi:hypothetical protein